MLGSEMLVERRSAEERGVLRMVWQGAAGEGGKGWLIHVLNRMAF